MINPDSRWFSKDSEPQNFQIEPDRPMLQIIKVVFNPFANRSITSPAADLSPAGDTRFQRVPFHVALNISPKNSHEVRPLWTGPYQAHVAAQQVHELTEFV